VQGFINTGSVALRAISNYNRRVRATQASPAVIVNAAPAGAASAPPGLTEQLASIEAHLGRSAAAQERIAVALVSHSQPACTLLANRA
jgi:hypothetical protein